MPVTWISEFLKYSLFLNAIFQVPLVELKPVLKFSETEVFFLSNAIHTTPYYYRSATGGVSMCPIVVSSHTQTCS